MLTDMQEDQLAAIVQRVSADLQVEDAQLDADQTLEVVLCREFVCFRPIRIASQDVDVQAALDGQPEAQAVLQARLRAALPDL